MVVVVIVFVVVVVFVADVVICLEVVFVAVDLEVTNVVDVYELVLKVVEPFGLVVRLDVEPGWLLTIMQETP